MEQVLLQNNVSEGKLCPVLYSLQLFEESEASWESEVALLYSSGIIQSKNKFEPRAAGSLGWK